MESVNKDIEEKLVTKELEFKLTQPEFAEKGKKAAAMAMEIANLEYEFNDAKKAAKGRIDAKKQELSMALRTIRAGVENRQVECTMQKDYVRHVVSYIFNGTVMHQRPLEMSERQMELASTTPRVDRKSADIALSKHREKAAVAAGAVEATQ